MVSLEWRDLGKAYGRRVLFRDLGQRVDRGQVLVITGPNGSGKSTLLRVLLGLTRPSRGHVTYHLRGAELAPLLAHPYVGLVSPDLCLYDDLTAGENLAFFARVRGVPSAPERVKDLLDRIGLSARRDDRLGTFSSGMKQRVKYACALLHRPPFLFLDEPTANLDEEGIRLVEELLAEQRRDGLAIIATNEQREYTYGDTLLRLG
jgi:heme exporter protein A